MTFSLLAIDPSGRWIGAATASRSLAVGNATISLQPALGAVVSQAWTNRHLHAWGHARLASGEDPDTALRSLPAQDPGHARRQVGLLSIDGRAAAHTGTDTTAWTGHEARTGLVALGNCLAGPEVLEAMSGRMSAAPEAEFDAFVVTLVEALRCGQDAGGDTRGLQGAAVLAAGVREGPAEWPPVLDVDLRVDDDRTDPVGRLLAMTRDSVSA
jgi:uncharacterized Ntn-hydrolase superfamily protein